MPEETVFLQEGGVLVTNSRFTHGTQTFAMANVTSVRPLRDGIIKAILAFAFGALFALAGGGARIFGILLIVVGLLVFALRKSYVLLHTAGGEQRALSSRNHKFIVRVVESVNNAIVHRG
jgi:hypothetical protein